ncbi:MAG: hypothetical protein IJR41_04860 [Atopobiaceae bacterium]|nr:hypothetical protein [Atopobiaceae bacterium]
MLKFLRADTDFTSYSVSVGGTAYNGVIDYDSHTIAVALPAGSTITSVVSTFITHDPSATVKIGSTAQTSGTTSNSWTSGTAKTYKVTSGTDSQDWAVTLTVAS